MYDVLALESIPIQDSSELLLKLSSQDFALEPVYFDKGLSRKRMFLVQVVKNY